MLLKNKQSTKKYFRGVYPRDVLPKLGNRMPNEENFYIVNFDTADEPGSHWVGMCLRRRGRNEYFDSYGLPPNYKEFTDFLGKGYVHSKPDLQHELTSVCGQWSVFYVVRRCQGMTMVKIGKMFSPKEQLVNDMMVNNSIETEFDLDNLEVVDVSFLKEQISRAAKAPPTE